MDFINKNKTDKHLCDDLKQLSTILQYLNYV